MSPGPATYRARSGFDSVVWRCDDPRSPNRLSQRHGSLPPAKLDNPDGLPSCTCLSRVLDLSSRRNSGRSPGTLRNTSTTESKVSKTHEAIMAELHGRLIRTVKIEIAELHAGTSLDTG